MVEHPIRRGVSLSLALMSVLVIASEWPRALPGEELWDFGSFVASGRAAREGLNPYGVYPLTLHVVLPGFDSWNPNLNPPISALLFQLFDWADPHLTFRIWWAVSVACYAATILLLVYRYRRAASLPLVLGTVALAGFWDTLELGQIYLPLVLSGTAAWLLLEKKAAVAAGILIGVVAAMKPNFLVWPVLLFLSGHVRPALVAVAVAAAISVIPLLVLGPEVYRQWFELIASDRERAAFLTNASLAGLTARVGLPALGFMLSLALLGLSAAWAFWRRPSMTEVSGVALVVALLASPLGWVHYTLFLLPVFFSRWQLTPIRVVALLLIVPVPFLLGKFGAPAWIQATVGSIYAWALLLCFATLAAAEWKRSVAPSSAAPAGAAI